MLENGDGDGDGWWVMLWFTVLTLGLVAIRRGVPATHALNGCRWVGRRGKMWENVGKCGGGEGGQ